MIKLNGMDINPTIFPDNTSQIWKLPEAAIPAYKELHVVEWEFSTEGEFLQLAQLKTLLDHYNYKSELRIKYLPYGRQDKKVSNETTFALTTFARLLNTLNFHTVWVLDPHSDEAKQINNLVVEMPLTELYKVKTILQPEIICFPDSGAKKRYGSGYRDEIYAEKIRDQKTGAIIDTKLRGDVSGKTVLIQDDLCDYGNTFIKLTALLLQNGAKEVNLFVTHGLFSGGIKVLRNAGIRRIFSAKGEAFDSQDHVVYKPFDKFEENRG
jgi:ribose-phosphate pyrophosphokinase